MTIRTGSAIFSGLLERQWRQEATYIMSI